MTSPRFSVDAGVTPHVRAGLVAFDDVRVTEGTPVLDAALAAIALPTPLPRDLEERVAAVRAMYRRFGVDPTKTRPSSEALLRRLRRGEPLPRVNSAVDVCNWCSVETQLPFGLYDASRIDGEIELRIGREAEAYAGIRKDVVHVAGRLTLADASGPFGNPTSDSARTMVTTASMRLLFVIFAPRALGEPVPRDALALTAGRVLAFCGGREERREIV